MHEHGGMNHQNEMNEQEAIALLKYMIDHNKHHASELHDLSHTLNDSASEKVHEALDQFNKANELLAEALKLAQGE